MPAIKKERNTYNFLIEDILSALRTKLDIFKAMETEQEITMRSALSNSKVMIQKMPSRESPPKLKEFQAYYLKLNGEVLQSALLISKLTFLQLCYDDHMLWTQRYAVAFIRSWQIYRNVPDFFHPESAVSSIFSVAK